METKRCSRCGQTKPLNEFTKGGSGSWCKVCQAECTREYRERKHAGSPPRKYYKYTDEQKQQWRQYVAQCGSIKEAGRYFGIDPGVMQPSVSDVLQEYKAEQDRKITEMRLAGKSMKETAAALHVSETLVESRCRLLNLGGKRSNRKADYTKMKHQEPDEAKARERIAEAGFDYVGGFTGCNGTASIRCRKCGNVFIASYQPIRRRGSIVCPVCHEAERQHTAEEAAKQKAADREAKKKAAEERKAKESERKQKKRQKICKECGEKFLDKSDGNSRSYCSEVCSHRAQNRLKDARRRGYKSNGTLTKLYYRDGGRCYICGGKCDFGDHQIIDGAFVVGPSYPTVEHVIPICRGGDDGEDNIKLACHRCNSKKSIKSSYKVERFGQIALVV